jgi:hypothetical protein
MVTSRRKSARKLALKSKQNKAKQTKNAYCKYFSLPCDAIGSTMEIRGTGCNVARIANIY